jgi:hypothetical protein
MFGLINFRLLIFGDGNRNCLGRCCGGLRWSGYSSFELSGGRGGAGDGVDFSAKTSPLMPESKAFHEKQSRSRGPSPCRFFYALLPIPLLKHFIRLGVVGFAVYFGEGGEEGFGDGFEAVVDFPFWLLGQYFNI